MGKARGGEEYRLLRISVFVSEYVFSVVEVVHVFLAFH